jgi:hypothetical protein
MERAHSLPAADNDWEGSSPIGAVDEIQLSCAAIAASAASCGGGYPRDATY